MLSRAELAERYCKIGMAVIPVAPGDKKPLGLSWQTRRMTPDEARRHWTTRPNENIGMVTGQTGWVVVDCDGYAAMQWALQNLPDTPLKVSTGSGAGLHLYYRWPVGEPIRKQQIHVPGLVRDAATHQSCDLYGDGAQVVMAGSVTVMPYWWCFMMEQDGLAVLSPDDYDFENAVARVPTFDLAWLPPKPEKVNTK